MSKLLSFSYGISLEFTQSVKDHYFVLRCMPTSFPGQRIISASMMIGPGADWIEQTDGFGNRLQIGQIIEPHRGLQYSVMGVAETDSTIINNTDASPIYGFASKFTAMSPQLEQFRKEIRAESPEALMRAVHDRLEYVPGSTDVRTSAAQAFEAGRGVCQDFAHIYTALARAQGWQCRYANGIHIGSTLSHAWCEIRTDGRWLGIDPTEGRLTDDTYIRFNVGRDFSDCPIECGNFKGGAAQLQTVSLQCFEIATDIKAKQRTEQ